MDYLSTPFNMRDYEIITKRLREKVHLDKAQGRRQTKGRIGSGTCLQNRGLHNYPMKYNREDIRSAKWSSENRRSEKQNVKVDRGNSSALREYSKDMFNCIVTNVSENNEKRVSQSRSSNVGKRTSTSSVSSQVSVGRERTGPTQDGSILYNNHRPRVLNSIRIRPNTHTGSLYNHEKSKAKKELRQAIVQKSNTYQLLDLSPKQRIGSSSSCTSSFLFIPKSMDSEYSDVFESDNNHRSSTVADFLSELDGLENSRHSDERLYSVIHEGAKEGGRPTSGHKLLPPSTPCSLNLVTLDEESSSESEDEKEDKEPEKPEPVQPPSPVKKGKAALPPPPEVLPEPAPPPKLILKGPKCWVDDASVTSTEPEEDETENIGDIPDEPGKANPKQADISKTEVGKANSKAAGPSKPETGKANAKQTDVAKTEIANKTNAKQTNPQSNAKVPVKNSAKDNINSPNDKAVITNGLANNVTNTVDNTPDAKVDAEKVTDVAKENAEKEKCLNGADNNSEQSDGVTYVLPKFICPSSERKSRESAIKDWLQSSRNLFCYQRSVPMV